MYPEQSSFDTQALEDKKLKSCKRVTTLIYALYGASIIFGMTIFVAIIMNYVKRPDARGTFLESHFTWQIRTFWFTLVLSLLGLFTAVLGIGVIILIVLFFWFIYRIVKGWLRLNDNLPMPVKMSG